MPASTLDAFRGELNALARIVSEIQKKTVRDDELRERFRTLFRTWSAAVRPAISQALGSRRESHKLQAELEALAQLASRCMPVTQYRKRLDRAIRLANDLVLYLPPQDLPPTPRPARTDELFISSIPDLPIRLVPNPLLGWRREMSAFATTHPFDRSVFIMVRYRPRNTGLISEVKQALAEYGLHGILASEHALTNDLYNPIACLLCCSRGIAIFDQAEADQKFNPNVAYELGMLHMLGRDALLLKHRTLEALHTDILMRLYVEYRTPGNATTEVLRWIGAAQEP